MENSEAFGEGKPARLAVRLGKQGGHEPHTRETVNRSQRERLINAMAESCATRGFGAATITEIVARAGMGRATFYKLFDSKDECFKAAVRTVVDELKTEVEAAGSEGGEWPEVVKRSFEAIVEVLAARPAFANLAFLESRAVDLDLLEPYREAFLALFKSGPTGKAALRGDSTVNAALVYSQVQAMFIGAGFSGQIPALRERIPTLVYLGVLPSMGPEEASRQMHELQ